MEQQVLDLLAATQLPAEIPRKDAESQLEQLYTNEAFPISLVSIASHNSIPLNLRQSALLVLKAFVLKAWSSSLDDYTGQILISDANKEQIRQTLLAIVTSGDQDRKIISAASYVVSKIASADFPKSWPSLLPTILHLVPRTNNGQLHGVLTVLGDLVEDGFDEEQFSESARDLVKCLFDVAVDGDKKLTLRALAVSIFRACFDTIEMVYQNNKVSVKQFMQEASDAWSPLFIDVLKMQMPTMPTEDDESEISPVVVDWRGVIALKIQVVKALEKIQQIFPQLLSAHVLLLFSSTWEALQAHLGPYHALYVHEDRQGRLEDADRLPYTLDFLILEELDYMQGLLKAPQVKKELEAQLTSDGATDGNSASNWVFQVLRTLVGYSQITIEEEGLWEIDVNIFLSEETSETANYSPRNACADFVRKLCDWLPTQALGSLLGYTRDIFNDETASWRTKEANLFILKQIMDEFNSEDRSVDPSVARSYIEYIRTAMNNNNDFLRSRGYIVAGTLTTASGDTLKDLAPEFAQQSLNAINNETSDIVKVSCIRVLQEYLRTLPSSSARDFQVQIVAAISNFLSNLDLSNLSDNEDLLDTLVETLRDAIMADPSLCLEHNALDVLFTMASYGATSFQTTILVNEAFESIATSMAARGLDAYAQLCAKVFPTLTGALDVADLTRENALSDLALSLLSSLAEHGPEPLPHGFVATIMPKLYRIIFSDASFNLHQTATTSIKYILVHDATQLLSWRDPETGKGGLEVILLIVDRLLGPSVDDNSAAEVGSLAVELVEKAGSEQLGPYLMQLLRVVAIRLSTADHASFIQNLVLVFARLSITNAPEVVEFLAQVEVEGPTGGTGLEVVMRKWLENSVNFSGYDSIRQNVIALANIYKLHDPRLIPIQVQGDLIVQDTGRIKTRSRAKQEPDQYTVINVPLKLLKVLIQELVHSTSPIRPGQNIAADDGSDDDDEWEDEPNVLDLGAPSTRSELMGYMDESRWNTRQWDDETQTFLAGFFRSIATELDFQTQYTLLNELERDKLNKIGQA